MKRTAIKRLVFYGLLLGLVDKKFVLFAALVE